MFRMDAESPMLLFVIHLDRPVHPVVAPSRRLRPFHDNHAIQAMAVSPDGTGLALVGSDLVSVIDTRAGGGRVDYRGVFNTDTMVLSLRFSPDGGRLVLGLSDGRVLVLDAAGEKGIVSSERIPAGRLASAAAMADGSLVVAARDYEGVCLWRRALSGRWEQKRPGCRDPEDIGVTSEGELVVVGKDGRIAVYDPETGEIRRVVSTAGRGQVRLWGLNDLAQVMGEDATHLIRLSDGRSIFFSWPAHFVSAAAMTPDGNRIYLSFSREGGTVYQYPANAPQWPYWPYLALSAERRTTLLVWANNSWQALMTATMQLGVMPDVLLAENGGGLIALTPGAGGERRLAVSWGETLDGTGWQWEISRITDIYGNTGSPLCEGQEASFPAVIRAIVRALTTPQVVSQ